MTAATCPSDLALELFLLERDRSPVAGHVGGCRACAQRLASMQEEGDEFRRTVFPHTVDAVEDAMAKRPFEWRRLFAPAGFALAAAAALLVTVRTPTGPPSDYEYGVKGTGLALGVFVNGGEGARSVTDGAAVPASAALRFKVQPSTDHCCLWIMSVDGKGEVSRIYPPEGRPQSDHIAGPVPGGAVLDGVPGPERIYAVCVPDDDMNWTQVKAAASHVASGGEAAVRGAEKLGGPLEKASQATMLLEKRP
jgi:hypothetical protein